MLTSQMQIGLIALATLAATGASFAQSSVTISGLLDTSYQAISGNGTNDVQKRNNVSGSGGSATSSINFNIVEDLGGGMRAQAMVQLQPSALIDSATGTLARNQVFLGLTGGFGQIRFGSINTGSVDAALAGSSLGTAVGSGFGQINTAVGSAVRFDNSVRYDTPRVNGFNANVTYAPGNKDGGATLAIAEVTDIGLSYAKGPLNVNFSSLSRSTTNLTAVLPKSTFNSIGANYTMGAARLFAQYGKGDKSSQTAAASTTNSVIMATTGGLDTELTRLGASYAMGAVTLLGQYSAAEIGTGANNKRTATGLRADYALSKRTVAYGAYEAFDTGATTLNKINTFAVGVRHTF